MDPLDAIESLARLARSEEPPRTNVNVAAVLRAANAEPPLRLAPLAWSAAVGLPGLLEALQASRHREAYTLRPRCLWFPG